MKKEKKDRNEKYQNVNSAIIVDTSVINRYCLIDFLKVSDYKKQT